MGSYFSCLSFISQNIFSGFEDPHPPPYFPRNMSLSCIIWIFDARPLLQCNATNHILLILISIFWKNIKKCTFIFKIIINLLKNMQVFEVNLTQNKCFYRIYEIYPKTKPCNVYVLAVTHTHTQTQTDRQTELWDSHILKKIFYRSIFLYCVISCFSRSG